MRCLDLAEPRGVGTRWHPAAVDRLADRAAQRLPSAGCAAEFDGKLPKYRLGPQVAATTADLMLEQFGQVEPLKQCDDIGEGLVKCQHIDVGGFGESRVHPVEDRVGGLVGDDVVRQAGVDRKAGQLRTGPVRGERAEEQRTPARFVEGICGSERMRTQSQTRHVPVVPTAAGLLCGGPQHRSAKRDLEVLNRLARHRIDHLLVELQIARRRGPAILRQQVRVVEAGRGRLGRLDLVVDDFEVFPAEPLLRCRQGLPRNLQRHPRNRGGGELACQCRILGEYPHLPVRRARRLPIGARRGGTGWPCRRLGAGDMAVALPKVLPERVGGLRGVEQRVQQLLVLRGLERRRHLRVGQDLVQPWVGEPQLRQFKVEHLLPGCPWLQAEPGQHPQDGPAVCRHPALGQLQIRGYPEGIACLQNAVAQLGVCRPRAAEQCVADGRNPAPVVWQHVLVLLDPQRRRRCDLWRGGRSALTVQSEQIGAAVHGPRDVRGERRHCRGVHTVGPETALHGPVQTCVRGLVRHHARHGDHPLVAGRPDHGARDAQNAVTGRGDQAQPVVVRIVDGVGPSL